MNDSCQQISMTDYEKMQQYLLCANHVNNESFLISSPIEHPVQNFDQFLEPEYHGVTNFDNHAPMPHNQHIMYTSSGETFSFDKPTMSPMQQLTDPSVNSLNCYPKFSQPSFQPFEFEVPQIFLECMSEGNVTSLKHSWAPKVEMKSSEEASFFLDNGDPGMMYVAHVGESGKLNVRAKHYSPEERYPKLNRKRPLWGDKFDKKEETENTARKIKQHCNNDTRPHYPQNKGQMGSNGRKGYWGKKKCAETNSLVVYFKQGQICKRNYNNATRPFSTDVNGKQNPKYKSEPCVNFPRGDCKFGDRCSFIHDLSQGF